MHVPIVWAVHIIVCGMPQIHIPLPLHIRLSLHIACRTQVVTLSIKSKYNDRHRNVRLHQLLNTLHFFINRPCNKSYNISYASKLSISYWWPPACALGSQYRNTGGNMSLPFLSYIYTWTSWNEKWYTAAGKTEVKCL